MVCGETEIATMSFAAVCADAYVHHISLNSPDPEALSRFYGKVLQMEVEHLPSGGWLCRGPNRQVVLEEGARNSLGHIGFAVRNSDALDFVRKGLERQDVKLLKSVCGDLLDDAFGIQDPDGNRVFFGVSKRTETKGVGLYGALQHVAYGTQRLGEMVDFYRDVLGFAEVDRVRNEQGELKVCFLRSNHEHHTVAIFQSDRVGLDHHAYEVGDWNGIRDWADFFSREGAPITWGPGRHGPGNNLFIFIEDADGNNIEVSAELEVVRDRPVIDWPFRPSTLNIWGPARMRSA